MSNTYIGLEQYRRCVQAAEFYEKLGYTFCNMPWAVSAQALSITKPARLPLNECPSINKQYIVASAEQSFLGDQIEFMEHFPGSRQKGRYVALTPCFRNKLDYNDLHHVCINRINGPYFLKVELINWTDLSETNLFDMIEQAEKWFSEFLVVDVEETNTASEDPLAVSKTFDIVSRRHRIELGSYGVRECGLTGRWLYGTGCAEPRLSYAIDKESK